MHEPGHSASLPSLSRAAETCVLCGGADLEHVPVRGVPSLLKCGNCDLLFRGNDDADISGDQPGSSELRRLGESRNVLYRAGLREFEHFRRTGVILDIGSGGGQFARLAQSHDWRVMALEHSIYLCGTSSSLARLPVAQGTASSLPFAPNRFDVVTMWDVLDHLVSPLPALREARRVLRPGGLLFVRVRNGPVHMALRKSALVPSGASVFHATAFSRSSLSAALDLAGFEGARIGCSRLTRGSPYGEISKSRETLLKAIKSTWQGASVVVSALTGGRLLLAPSIRAVAVRPGA